jgi:hypothetical protein
VSAVLRTRLKISDLTAWTALDAARKLLPAGQALHKLVREEVFVFEPTLGLRATEFETQLAHAIESSNFFVNPNKEQYRFTPAEERGASLAPPEGAWGLLARSRGDTSDEGLIERLLREHPMKGLGAIRRARLWWLWTEGPRGGAGDRDACYRAVGPVTGSRHGLLVNPHSEADLRIDGPTAWDAVEAFLRAPAASRREAA